MIHLEQETARILQAPIDEWHTELRAGGPMISGKFRLDRHGQFMFAAMQNKNPVQLNCESARGRNFSVHPVRPENDILVSRAFENFFVHFLVARIVAAIPAGGEYDDFTANFAAPGVNVQSPVFERKRSMNGVERRAKRPVHSTLSGVEAKNKFTGERRRAGLGKRCGDQRSRQGGKQPNEHKPRT